MKNLCISTLKGNITKLPQADQCMLNTEKLAKNIALKTRRCFRGDSATELRCY
jgi:hypothetical protein